MSGLESMVGMTRMKRDRGMVNVLFLMVFVFGFAGVAFFVFDTADAGVETIAEEDAFHFAIGDTGSDDFERYFIFLGLFHRG